jgi:hypothetical protein
MKTTEELTDIALSGGRLWEFYTESRDYTFTLWAKDEIEAYDKAYENYGPQVMQMSYKEIKPS